MSLMKAKQISMPTFYEHFARTYRAKGNIVDLMVSVEMVPSNPTADDIKSKIGSANVKLSNLREWYTKLYGGTLPALARRERTASDGTKVSAVEEGMKALGDLFAEEVPGNKDSKESVEEVLGTV